MPDPNLFGADWDQETDRGPWRWRRAVLGRHAGSERLGASLFEVPPGGAMFPYHAHHANEELLFVLEGRPTLRTPTGEREVEPGAVVAFPAGRRGAHRIENRSDAPVRLVMVSTMVAPDINEFPDSGTLWARSFAPGTAAGADDVIAVGRVGDALDPLAGDSL
jgi:uncharacterized cupin superfamily protein